jgi:hypothetical protein
MADTVTAQNIDISSPKTLYKLDSSVLSTLTFVFNASNLLPRQTVCTPVQPTFQSTERQQFV